MSTRTMQYQMPFMTFRVLAEDAANLALRGTADDDWMVAANAESALALRELAAGAARMNFSTFNDQPRASMT